MASEPRRKKRGFRGMIVGVMATGTGERTNGPDREERVGAARQRLVQELVLLGPHRVGFVELDVHHDGARALPLQLCEHLAIHRAGPRKAADLVGHHAE